MKEESLLLLSDLQKLINQVVLIDYTIIILGGEKMQVIKEIWRDEKGIGTVEMILILVVLIGLVLIFKRQLTTIVNNIFKTISTESGKV